MGFFTAFRMTGENAAATDVTLCPRAVGRQALAPESLETRSRDAWAVVRAPLAALAAFLLLAALANWLAGVIGVLLCVCPFKLLTGLPCPGCGATRAALSLLSGHVREAWGFNPLMACAYLLAPLWLALRCLARKRAVIELSGPARWAAVSLLAVAICANWAYLIASNR